MACLQLVTYLLYLQVIVILHALNKLRLVLLNDTSDVRANSVERREDAEHFIGVFLALVHVLDAMREMHANERRVRRARLGELHDDEIPSFVALGDLFPHLSPTSITDETEQLNRLSLHD